MSEKPSSKWHTIALVGALMLTIGLFVIGGKPEAGQVFKGVFHWLAHLGAYGLIAAVYCFALPRLTWPYIALIVAGIGGVHEFYEITAHGHEFEYLDAAVNGIGASIGAFIGCAVLRRRTETEP